MREVVVMRNKHWLQLPAIFTLSTLRWSDHTALQHYDLTMTCMKAEGKKKQYLYNQGRDAEESEASPLLPFIFTNHVVSQR